MSKYSFSFKRQNNKTDTEFNWIEKTCKSLTLCGKIHCQKRGQHFTEILTSVQPVWFETLSAEERRFHQTKQTITKPPQKNS